MTRKRLDDEQARHLLKAGEFPEAVLGVSAKVAVILTQSWCPQWTFMNSYLNRMSENGGGPEDLTVWEYIYDRSPFFPEFLDYKERVFGNYDIPYVRYYDAGSFMRSSNFVSPDQFLAFFRT